MLNTFPRKIGNVDKTIYTTEINKCSVRGNVFDGSLEYLTFFKACNNFFLLLFEFFFNQYFVRYNHIFEFGIDFYNLEFHCFIHKHVVVVNGIHINLRTGQECFDSEHVYNHTAFCAAFDISFDDFIISECFIYTLP